MVGLGVLGWGGRGLQGGAGLLERVEDAAGVGELDAVVDDGVQDTGEGVEGLLVGGGGGDGEVAASDAPGAARLGPRIRGYGAVWWIMSKARHPTGSKYFASSLYYIGRGQVVCYGKRCKLLILMVEHYFPKNDKRKRAGYEFEGRSS